MHSREREREKVVKQLTLTKCLFVHTEFHFIFSCAPNFHLYIFGRSLFVLLFIIFFADKYCNSIDCIEIIVLITIAKCIAATVPKIKCPIEFLIWIDMKASDTQCTQTQSRQMANTSRVSNCTGHKTQNAKCKHSN